MTVQTLKKILKMPFRIADVFLDRITVFFSAVLFAQFPQFYSHYMQRLGGHIDELNSIVRRYNSAAAGSGKTIEAYIDQHLNSSIQDFVSSGKIMLENVDRLSTLVSSQKDILSTNTFTRLPVFIREINIDIFRSTFDSFKPGIEISTDAMIYAAAGIVFGLLMYFLIKKILSGLYSLISGNKKNDASTGNMHFVPFDSAAGRDLPPQGGKRN